MLFFGEFREYGIIVVVAEPAGYGNSTGLNRKTQYLVVESVSKYVQNLASKEQLKIVIAGSSLGSFSAIHAVHSGIGNKLLLHAPITALEELAAALYPFLPVRALMKDDYKYNNMDKIQTIKDTLCSTSSLQVLVIHGDLDEIVPQHYGKHICDLLDNCCTFINATGYHHNNIRLSVRGPFYDRMSKFLLGD